MSIAWSCVARDGVILAEAGSDDGKGSVVRTAQKIGRAKPTAGWEKAWSFRDAPYRGLKLHLHEADDESDRVLVWTFCCVYDSKKTTEECAKSFLTKVLYVTEPLRGCPWWREGETLSAQPSFAPTLQQQMEDADRNARLLVLHHHVDETKEIMASNIENILDRGEKIENLEAESEELNQMSQVFKKRAKQVKRFKMWQNAKHGVMVGTAVTGAVGVIVIPPLIALL
ncbi:hypothetical protein ACHAWF_018927 [Thalassiosira exigua]